MENRKIDISPKSIVALILIALGFFFIYELRGILMIVFVAIIIASAFDPFVSYLQKNRVPRALSVIFLYIISFLFIGVIFYLAVPPLLKEFEEFFGSTSYYYYQLRIFLGEYKSVLPFSSSEILSQLPQYFKVDDGGSVVGFVSKVFGGMVHIIAAFVVSMYLLMRENGIQKFLRYITPRKHENYVMDLWSRVKKKFGSWFVGQLFLGLTIGILVFIGLTVLQVKYALFLAVLAGIFELVPYVGPILSSVPAIIVGFSQSPILGLMVLALYILAQQMENHIIVPLVMKKAVGLDPVFVIVALLTGAKLGGMAGMLVAVPLAAIIVEIFADFVEKKPVEAEIL